MPDLTIAVILGSTRPGRNGKSVADWVTDKAAGRPAANYELVDYLYAEWNNKAAAFVSYGALGGARAIEHLRAICSCVRSRTRDSSSALPKHGRIRQVTVWMASPER
jgi:NAD(P)H-dependent FMN reductase